MKEVGQLSTALLQWPGTEVTAMGRINNNSDTGSSLALDFIHLIIINL